MTTKSEPARRILHFGRFGKTIVAAGLTQRQAEEIVQRYVRRRPGIQLEIK